jgi:hypothetical protein
MRKLFTSFACLTLFSAFLISCSPDVRTHDIRADGGGEFGIETSPSMAVTAFGNYNSADGRAWGGANPPSSAGNAPAPNQNPNGSGNAPAPR